MKERMKKFKKNLTEFIWKPVPIWAFYWWILCIFIGWELGNRL